MILQNEPNKKLYILKICEYKTFSIFHFLFFNNMLKELPSFILYIWTEKYNSDKIFNSISPRAEINLAILVNLHAHVLPGHVMILGRLRIHKVCVRNPEQICRIGRHIKWCAGVVFKPRVYPPLAEENVHAVFLEM